MTPLTSQERDQVRDYVLDLLPETERAAMAQRLAHDERLRTAVARARRLETAVRDTLRDLPEPHPARLAALMPDPPAAKERRGRWSWPFWGRGMQPVAAVLVVLLVFVGGRQWVGSRATVPTAEYVSQTAVVTVNVGAVPPATTPIATATPRPAGTAPPSGTMPADVTIPAVTAPAPGRALNSELPTG